MLHSLTFTRAHKSFEIIAASCLEYWNIYSAYQALLGNDARYREAHLSWGSIEPHHTWFLLCRCTIKCVVIYASTTSIFAKRISFTHILELLRSEIYHRRLFKFVSRSRREARVIASKEEGWSERKALSTIVDRYILLKYLFVNFEE